MKADTLWVVSVISNPVRYKSRIALYNAFERRVLASGANLLTVELALGGRDFDIYEDGKKISLRLRARDELWHKENLINIAVQNLPENWEYVAWLDSDIEFIRPDWPVEIVHQLQHYKIIQVFQDAIDLGPNGEFLQKQNGFAWSYQTLQPRKDKCYNYPHWHPGFGWACDRESWNNMGGLLDVGILGSSDHHMAWALIGEVLDHIPDGLTNGYRKRLKTWEEQVLSTIRKDIGWMPGTIIHHWHGSKKNRKYQERWKILQKHQFDPDKDLIRDWQGVYEFSYVGERLRDDIRRYFRSRNEDSIDV